MNLDKLKDHICTEEYKYDIRHKEVYVGDIVSLPVGPSTLKIAIVAGFTPSGFRLINQKGSKQNYFGSLINITKLYSSEELKEFDKIRNEIKIKEEEKKKQKITQKLILAAYFDKNTKEYGIYTRSISSKPGKSISKSEIKIAMEEMKSKYPNFDFYFMNNNFDFEDKDSNSIPYTFTDYSLPSRMFYIGSANSDLYALPMKAIRIANKYGMVDSNEVIKKYNVSYNSNTGTEKYVFKTDTSGYCLINPGWRFYDSPNSKLPIFIYHINALFEKFEKEINI